MSQNTTAMQRGASGETTGATDMTTKQTEALQCAADLEYSIARHGMQNAFTLNAYKAMKMVRRQHARIAELEAQLEAVGAGGVSGPLMGQPQAMPDLTTLTERGATAWACVDAQELRGGGADISKEREDFNAWLRTYEEEVGAIDEAAAWAGFSGARASLAASAGSEPVATVFTMEALTPGGGVKYHATIHKQLPAGTKLYTRPSPQEGMAGWQPIETAPKDGETYLVADAVRGMVAPHIRGVIHNNPGTAHDWQYGEAATHWMPLPPPPSSAQREVSNG